MVGCHYLDKQFCILEKTGNGCENNINSQLDATIIILLIIIIITVE